jgi:hypothetical protein
MILEGVAIGLGRIPVRDGPTLGKTRTFCVVLVDTRTEKWILSEGKYKGGKRYEVQVPPDFRCYGQTVKIRVPDAEPGAMKFRPHIIDGDQSGLSQ